MIHLAAALPSSRVATPRSGTSGPDVGRKVPHLLWLFWVIKIAATTVGETGGDAVSMSLGFGYAAASALFLVVLAILVARQIAARSLHPALYWSVIVATTLAGTTMADFTDRSLGVGYGGGATILLAALVITLGAWRVLLGRIEADHVADRRTEAFYWLAILVSNTLGTSLGDFASSQPGIGYEGGALIFSVLLLAVVLTWLLDAAPFATLFWAAFVLTRPLGATLGDILTKPRAKGGLALDRFDATAAVLAVVVAGVALYPARPPR